MDAIKALDEATGRSIHDILTPTMQILVPLLLKNKEAILSVPRREESYGPYPRQKLDVYLPFQESDKNPLLVFFHGGGLIRGDKIAPTVPEHLLYHNLGSFFAQKGITTIVANYRRVNSPSGGEDAVYPSGGDDVSLVLKWLEGFEHKGSGNVVIMGNSAGGVHVSTFLLRPQYLEQRKSLAARENGIKVVGTVLCSVPAHFKFAEARRNTVLETYYGNVASMEKHCPFGLLEAVGKTGKTGKEIGVTELLFLLGEYDPEDEIGRPFRDFADLAKKICGPRVDLKLLKGHNHISPPPTLMTGDMEGEQWGVDLADRIKLLNI